MTVQELQKQIMSKNIDHVLLLYGEEVAIMDEYLARLYKVLGVQPSIMESVSYAYNRLVQRRLNAAPRVIVVRDDTEFLKADKQWGKVFAAAENGDDYLIIIYSKVDKRGKFYKQNQERLCEFQKLNSSILATYVARLIPGMRESDCLEFAETCECDYSRIKLEADKVNHYHAVRGGDPGRCALELIQSGVIYKPIGDITFQFTDAILTRNVRSSFEYLLKAKAVNEPSILTLSVLYNGFKQILMVQGLGRDQSEPVKRTGLTPWQVKMAKEKQGHYSLDELVNALKLIRFVEKGIKTGLIDDDVAVEYVMVNIL